MIETITKFELEQELICKLRTAIDNFKDDILEPVDVKVKMMHSAPGVVPDFLLVRFHIMDWKELRDVCEPAVSDEDNK